MYRTARLLSKYTLGNYLKDLPGKMKQLLRKGTHLIHIYFLNVWVLFSMSDTLTEVQYVRGQNVNSAR